MKRTALLIALALWIVFPADAQETSGSFTQGSVSIGYDNRTCNAGLEGSIRYNSGGPSIEICNSSSWVPWED